jgi:hypothetical protein
MPPKEGKKSVQRYESILHRSPIPWSMVPGA